MFAAGSTVPGNQIAQVFAGAVESHGKVVPGQTQLGCNLGWLFAIQINLLEQFPVLLGHRRQKASETLAEQTFVADSGCFSQLGLESGHRPPPGIVASIKVDDRAAQNPVKPCHRILFAGGFAVSGQRFEKAVLHEIGRQRFIANAFAGKTNEGLEILQQGVFEAVHGLILVAALPAGKVAPRRKIICNETPRHAFAWVK